MVIKILFYNQFYIKKTNSQHIPKMTFRFLITSLKPTLSLKKISLFSSIFTIFADLILKKKLTR